jgi:hypothetical protein
MPSLDYAHPACGSKVLADLGFLVFAPRRKNQKQ